MIAMEKSVLQDAVMEKRTGSAVTIKTTAPPLRMTALLPTSSTWSLSRFDLCLYNFCTYKILRFWKKAMVVMGLYVPQAAVRDKPTGTAVQMDSIVLPLKITALLTRSATWQDWRQSLRRFDFFPSTFLLIFFVPDFEKFGKEEYLLRNFECYFNFIIEIYFKLVIIELTFVTSKFLIVVVLFPIIYN